MSGTMLSAGDHKQFLERFSYFEDGVITGIRLHIPRGGPEGRTAVFDIQARDRTAGLAWRLVRITVFGVHEYQFPCSRQMTYFVLSDGLNMECVAGSCVLDLDPGPDEWSTAQVGQPGVYSKQYVIGAACGYEVLDGPFI
jgi:hypothetical protein